MRSGYRSLLQGLLLLSLEAGKQHCDEVLKLVSGIELRGVKA